MKLSDWAKKQGISYLTAYRWFKDGKLPIKAYQSDSGTIIVQDESENLENHMGSNIVNQSNDTMSTFLKKTVEFSKNNGSVEDFAAYVLSNFSLKLNNIIDTPKYSRNKPKSEEIQKHFQQFLKPKGEKPKPNMLIADDEAFDKLAEQSDSLATQELAEQLSKFSGTTVSNCLPSVNVVPEVQDLLKDLTAAFTTPNSVLGFNNSVKTYGSTGADSIVNRIELTPQLTNYTDSVNDTISDPFYINIPNVLTPAVGATGAFKPTQKEIESVTKTIEKVANDLHAQVVKSKRGRKPSKKK